MKIAITKKMEETINEKEKHITMLKELSNKLVYYEIKEYTKRVELMNKIDTSYTEKGKKITEKSKVAKCDAELKPMMDKIKWLKKDISTVKRDIELCNDKLSLYRNMIREMEIISQ